jgi:hypothetical protein
VFPRLALVLALVLLGVGGVAVAAPSKEQTSVYALVDANGGKAPTFATQDGMKSVRRVARGRYCLQPAAAFSGAVVAQLSADLSLSGGRRGVAMFMSKAPRCRSGEFGVATFQFAAGGRLRLSNQISFIGDPEG